MNWHKLVLHDLRCGLLRKRYAATILLFALPCLICHAYITATTNSCTWADYMLYCFKGIAPISLTDTIQDFRLPILWLICMGGLLFLCLDYPLNDLTNAGQQVIFRCGSKVRWYLSKCVWNLCSSLLYFALAAFTTALFTLLSGGSLSLRGTPELAPFLLDTFDFISLSAGKTAILTIVSPFLTLAALNMIQMTLCLLIKPVYSFLLCMSALVLSIYWPSAFALGNGAMAVRSALSCADGISTSSQISIAVGAILVATAAGTIKFKRFDILGQEE